MSLLMILLISVADPCLSLTARGWEKYVQMTIFQDVLCYPSQLLLSLPLWLVNPCKRLFLSHLLVAFNLSIVHPQCSEV